MRIFPAIDLYEEKAVRLYKGDYNQMTVYNEDPVAQAVEFENLGAEFLHVVDLEGAKEGLMSNYEVVRSIVNSTNLFVEIGGGIRSMPIVEAYLSAGVGRVILGTAAVTNEDFLKEALSRHREQIAVGIDVRDGYVATRGWTEQSEYKFFDFCKKMEDMGVTTIICTDISKDGAMQGANREMYQKLSEEVNIKIVASGGVSTIEDVKALREMGMYGTIIGKAYYIGAIDIKEALKAAK